MRRLLFRFFKKKIDLRDLLRFNSAIVLTVFTISALIICWRTYDFLRASQNREINLLLEHESSNLESRFESYKINLENLKALVAQGLKPGQKIDLDVMDQVMTSMVAQQPYVQNAYFALTPKYAQKNFKEKFYVVFNHKDIRLMNTDEFSKKENVVREIYTDVDYVNNPNEIWYHAAQAAPGMQITDPYFDASYMKMTMFSVSMAVQDSQGSFAGVVGFELPMSLWLNESYKRSVDHEYRVLLVNQQKLSLESLLLEKFTFSNPKSVSEFELDAKDRKFSLEKHYEINDGNGKIFDAQSKPIWGGKYNLTVIRDRDRVTEPLKLFFMSVALVLLIILILQTALSRFVSTEILKSVSRLFENFKLNSRNLRANKGHFEPQHLEELRIKELDHVRIFWDDFLREFEQSLSELRTEKEKADKAADFQSSFLANMSHEIRTPMNAIVGMTDMLSETALTDDQKKYLQIFKRSTNNLLNLLNDILDMAKIESGHLKIENVNTNLEKMREDVMLMYYVQAESKNLRLNFDIAPDLPRHVMIDSYRLRQILFNLVGNAIKFTDSGSVTIRFHRQNKNNILNIEVKDTGIGIPHYKMNDIFKKFTQADASTTRKFGGTGLGLSIVHSLVSLMKGAIDLESHVGRGSVFKVRLPFTEITSTIQAKTKSIMPLPNIMVAEKDPPSQKKILLVDDVLENRMVIQLYLKSIGLDYEMAENGQEAVDQYSRGDYDVVLMDIQMPIKDGVTAMKEIRTIQKAKGLKTSVIALTAFASLTDSDKYLNAGFDGYLAKPLTKQTFTTALNKFLN